MKRTIISVLTVGLLLLPGCSEEYDSTGTSPTSDVTSALQKRPSGGGQLELVPGQAYVAGGTMTGTLKVWSFTDEPKTWTNAAAAGIGGTAIGDPDNDGYPELVSIGTYKAGKGNNSVSALRLDVWESNLTDMTSTSLTNPPPVDIADVTIGTLTGSPSIVVGTYQTWEVFTYQGPPNPILQSSRTGNVDGYGNGTFKHVVGDADNDGANELVFCGSDRYNQGKGFISIFDYTGGVYTYPFIPPAVTSLLFRAIVGNLPSEPDYSNSVIAGGHDNRIFIWNASSYGMYSLSTSEIPILEANIRDIAVADFDGDLENEIAVAVTQNQPNVNGLYVIKWSANNGNSRYEVLWSMSLSTSIFAIATGDIDGGAPELVVATGNGLIIYKYGGGSSFYQSYSDGSVKDLFTVCIGKVP